MIYLYATTAYITAAENIGEIMPCEFSVNGAGDVVPLVSKIRPWSSFWVIFTTSVCSHDPFYYRILCLFHYK